MSRTTGRVAGVGSGISHLSLGAGLLGLLFLAPMPALAATLEEDFVEAGYTVSDLGDVPGVPTNYGGLTIRSGEPDVLYIGGAANAASGGIYRIGLVRDEVTRQIVGFVGEAERYVDAPNVDGGVVFASNGTLLYTRYPTNAIGQVLTDETTLSVMLGELGVTSSVGSMAFVPAGMPGEGSLVVSSYNGSVVYRLPWTIAPDGAFVFEEPDAEVSVSGTASGPEGLAYVPAGSPAFDVPSMLVSAYSLGAVVAFEVDADGLPDTETARTMLSGLTGAEGAWIDPVTGDFVFSTFGGGNRVIVVSGFAKPADDPEPSGTGEPGTGEPGTGEPGTGEPGTGEPGTGEPGPGEPGTGSPGTGEPGTGGSGGGEATMGEPGTSGSDIGEPGDGTTGADLLEEDEACGCSAAPRRGDAGWWLLVAGLMAGLRRRRP